MMQGLPDQLDGVDYITVPSADWRALVEEVATIRRLLAELAARLPAVDDIADDEVDGREGRSRSVADVADGRDKESGGGKRARIVASGTVGDPVAGLAAGDAGASGASGRPTPASPDRVALRPTVVRRDELGRSIRAYEVPLQPLPSGRAPGRRGGASRQNAAPVAGARTPTLEALRTRVEQAVASQAADAKRSSRLARWTSRLSGRQPGSGAGF